MRKPYFKLRKPYFKLRKPYFKLRKALHKRGLERNGKKMLLNEDYNHTTISLNK